MDYVAAKPKVSKATKEKIVAISQNDDFISKIKAGLKADQEFRAKYSWSGWVSPSAKLNFDMCIEEYFEEQMYPGTRVPPTTKQMYAMALGLIAHAGLQELSKYYADMRYALPHVTDHEIMRWYESKVLPEYPIWCKESGIKGKADFVVRRNDRPAVVDAKNTHTDRKTWRGLLYPRYQSGPKINDLVQVCIYANRLNVAETFDKKIKEVGVCYLNWGEKPFTRFWAKTCWVDYWNDYRKQTGELILSIGEGWQQAKAIKPGSGERVSCTNLWCVNHGTKRVWG